MSDNNTALSPDELDESSRDSDSQARRAFTLPSNGPAHATESGQEFQENRNLSERPTFSIRTRIILVFFLFFALCTAISVWSIWGVSQLEYKIRFLEIAGNYLREVQQARRFEKNYLLYGTNFEDAREHIQEAERILRQDGKTVEVILGRQSFQKMFKQVKDYEQLLHKLGQNHDKQRIEPELRSYGSQMVTFANDFVEKERDAVDRMLLLARRIPFLFLGILLVLMIFVITFLVRQLLSTLSRFMEYARRIGEGDFTPITPRRKYKDEFTELAMAFNHMTRELDRRHRILVESHKLRAIGTLVAGVAHELNNPLNNTMLTAGILQEDFTRLSDEEKIEMIGDLMQEAERARKIVRNLLDFARESEASISPLSVCEIVEASIRLVANQIKLARIHLETNFHDDIPPVHGDEQMLKQVFVNLILNAVDVLPPKGRMWISISNADEDGYLAVEVRDNGPGIPEHILPRLFDPFFTTKTRGKGTGLGLSVSQGIIRKHGGYIRVESTVGSGSTFTVFLPTTKVPSAISAGVPTRFS